MELDPLLSPLSGVDLRDDHVSFKDGRLALLLHAYLSVRTVSVHPALRARTFRDGEPIVSFGFPGRVIAIDKDEEVLATKSEEGELRGLTAARRVIVAPILSEVLCAAETDIGDRIKAGTLGLNTDLGGFVDGELFTSTSGVPYHVS